MEEKIDGKQFADTTYIRFARKSDIDAIMRFIHDYWSKTHILAKDREIFEFQYVYGDEVCFVLSLVRETEEIEGVLGYIPYASEGERDIFTALWKVKKGKNMFQGMELLYFLEENARCRFLFCAGINPGTFSIYKYMKKEIGSLRHYYMLNDLPDYRIAEISVKKFAAPAAGMQVTAVEGFEEFAEDFLRIRFEAYPRKSLEYIKRRYFEHPEYRYEVFRIAGDGECGFLFCRVQEAEGSRVLRIVDYMGSAACFAGAGEFLHGMMKRRGFEYVDMLALGMPEETMEKAGFVGLEEEDSNIIPNYFEPFVRENVTIYTFCPKGLSVRMFKGDGDQDRPNFRNKG